MRSHRKNVDASFCNSVMSVTSETSFPSCVWDDRRSSAGWQGDHHGLQARIFLPVLTVVTGLEERCDKLGDGRNPGDLLVFMTVKDRL